MVEKAPGSDELRRRVAGAAVDEVRPGMRLGLGSGRTAEHFVRLLGERVRSGLEVVGVPTSERTAEVAKAAGVPLTTLDAHPELDLAVDGADEIDPSLRLIKGGGGAMLREKIVACAARRMLVVGEASKLVNVLGAFPLAIEVIPFGLGTVRLAIERAAARLGLVGELRLRTASDTAFRTDGGNFVLDASFGRIPDAEALAAALDAIPGIVEHGLFIGIAAAALIGRDGGVDVIAS